MALKGNPDGNRHLVLSVIVATETVAQRAKIYPWCWSVGSRLPPATIPIITRPWRSLSSIGSCWTSRSLQWSSPRARQPKTSLRQRHDSVALPIKTASDPCLLARPLSPQSPQAPALSVIRSLTTYPSSVQRAKMSSSCRSVAGQSHWIPPSRMPKSRSMSRRSKRSSLGRHHYRHHGIMPLIHLLLPPHDVKPLGAVQGLLAPHPLTPPHATSPHPRLLRSSWQQQQRAVDRLVPRPSMQVQVIDSAKALKAMATKPIARRSRRSS